MRIGNYSLSPYDIGWTVRRIGRHRDDHKKAGHEHEVGAPWFPGTFHVALRRVLELMLQSEAREVGQELAEVIPVAQRPREEIGEVGGRRAGQPVEHASATFGAAADVGR